MKEIKIRNKRVDDDLLMKRRRAELDKWPTGKEVDFEEAVAYQKSLPDSKIWWKVMVKLREEGRMSVFPRAGTPILEKMIELCQGLRESGVVLIPVTTDSYTRWASMRRSRNNKRKLSDRQSTVKRLSDYQSRG